MITQVVSMVNDGGEQARIIGEIDTDRIFWAYAEVFENGEWVRDDATLSYQRDNIAVPNIEHDPEVLCFFANFGWAKVGDTKTSKEWVTELEFVKNFKSTY